jgi:hypothetical protein
MVEQSPGVPGFPPVKARVCWSAADTKAPWLCRRADPHVTNKAQLASGRGMPPHRLPVANGFPNPSRPILAGR